MLAGIGRRPSSPDCAANGLTCAVGGRPPWTAWIFDTYVETQLVPRLRPGDIVILDIVARPQRPRAILKQRGAWFLLLLLTAQTSIRS